MPYRLRESLHDAPVVRTGDYDYFVHPLTDGVPHIDPALLRETVEAIKEVADLGVDRIVTIEAMGIPAATALSLDTGIPLTIIRKRAYGLPGEIHLDQTTGYGRATLYANGLTRDHRLLVVDDVLSTGGTLRGLLGACREHGLAVADVVVLFEKAGDVRQRLEEEFDVGVKSLLRVTVEDGHVKVLD